MLKVLLLEFLVPFLVLFFLLTQLILPMFFRSLDFMWLFKRAKVKEDARCQISELSDLQKEAEEKTEQYQHVVKTIEDTEKKLESIKDKTKIN